MTCQCPAAVYVGAGFSPPLLHLTLPLRALISVAVHTCSQKQKAPNPIGGLFSELFSVLSVLCLFSVSSVLILSFFLSFSSLPHYLLPLAVHRIQRPPKRIQGLIRRLQDFFLIAARVLFQPPAPSCSVRLVRFFVYLEVRQPLWLSHAVKLLQPINLRRRNFRHLRFVGIQRGHRFRHWPVPADLAELLHHCLRPRQRRAARNVILAHSHGRRKITPKLRMRPRWILFLRHVLPDQSLQRTLRPRRQHPQE